MGLRDHLKRQTVPSTVIALSRVRSTRRLAAKVSGLFGITPRVELYFAFDDPYAALALPALRDVTRRYHVPLDLFPLIERGIPDDPAAAQRAEYAVVDANRLANRTGRRLGRTQPLIQDECAFLAAWTEAARGRAGAVDFAAAAATQLWVESNGPVLRRDYASIYRGTLGFDPPVDHSRWFRELRDNRRTMLAKGHWESPATLVAGEWFFAHERIPVIAERLQELTR